jgi:flap endonuclease-1
MGIKGLTALISEHAPKAIQVLPLAHFRRRRWPAHPAPVQEHDIKTLFGRKVAIDASMSIYQFLIAVRSKDGEMLTNEAGETTRYATDSTQSVREKADAIVVTSWACFIAHCG